MRIYPDNSILNRPFDDQSQPRIALETQAVVTLLAMVQSGEITLVSSAVIRYENSRNPDLEERRWVEELTRLAKIDQRMNSAIAQRSRELTARGLKPLDALHVASAEAAGVVYFLTCDDRLSRHYTGPLTILNPVDFILKVSEQ